MELKATPKSMDDVFRLQRKYVIPRFQREFSWELEDLSIYTTLNALNIFNTTQVRIFLLALFDAKKRDVLSHKNYKKILTYLEYYHFVFTAVCSSRPSGLERRYSSYARKLRACTRLK